MFHLQQELRSNFIKVDGWFFSKTALGRSQRKRWKDILSNKRCVSSKSYSLAWKGREDKGVKYRRQNSRIWTQGNRSRSPQDQVYPDGKVPSAPSVAPAVKPRAHRDEEAAQAERSVGLRKNKEVRSWPHIQGHPFQQSLSLCSLTSHLTGRIRLNQGGYGDWMPMHIKTR